MKQFIRYFGISILLFSCSGKKFSPEIPASVIAISQPKAVVLDALADSLQPEIISRKNLPGPRIIPIPQREGETIRYQDETGSTVLITLSPPKTKELLVLSDPNGQALSDRTGKSFLLGEGGISQFKSYTTDDGLALDGVNCAILDRRGHLWFGTNGGGLSRYDGNNFTNFTNAHGLVNNTVRSIWEDKDGMLWIGTLSGLSLFDGHKFTNYTTSNGLPHQVIFDITEDNNGHIWMGTGGGGVVRFDREKFTAYTTADGLADDVVVAVGKDAKGRLYFGTNGGGFSIFDGSGFSNFNQTKGLAGDRVRSFGSDASGSMWIGTIGSGVSRFDGTSFQNFTIEDGLADNIVRSIQEDRSGNIWFGTEHGVSRFDGKNFISYTRDQGLSANAVLDIVMDDSGKLWFGTDGGGVSRFDGSSFTSFTVNQGLGANIVLSSLEDSKGNLWFGTFGGGVSKFDRQGFTTYSLDQGLAGDIVYSLMEDADGVIWIGTSGGLSQIDGKNITTFTSAQGILSTEIYSILQDQKGRVWLGGDLGLSLIEKNQITHFGPNQGLPGSVILSLQAEKDGSIWIGAVDGGLAHFDGKRILPITTVEGLVDNGVIQIKLDQQENLWIGTEHGLNLLTQTDKKELLRGELANFHKFTTDHGLPDNVILQVVPLKNGKVAVGTNLGIVYFDQPNHQGAGPAQLQNLEIFNSNTGFPVKDLTDGQFGMFEDQFGILWAGTGSNKTALVRFDYAALVRNQEAPKVFLKQIRINEEIVPWSTLSSESPMDQVAFEEISLLGKTLSDVERTRLQDRFKDLSYEQVSPFFQIPDGLELPYRHNHLNIDFGTNELAKPFLVEYQYFLEGYDEEWSPVLKKTSATFGNIQEGEYTFLVKARFTGPSEAEAGEWTEPIAFTFTVLPPWYRTWWAFVIYSLLLLSLIYPVHQHQRNLTIKKEQEKARERELQQAREIEKAYSKLEVAHENLKSTQAQLIQQEKLASLGQLTAGIAHEIKNPLNFVNNFSGLSLEFIDEIEEELDKMEASDAVENVRDLLTDVKTNLTKIKHHGGRADGIVKSMLMHSRGGSGAMEPADLNEVIKEYVNLSFHGMRANKNPINVEIQLELGESLPKIPLNSEDFSRVILNLTKNAFDAMREKANQSGPDYKPKLTVRTRDLGEKILLEVEDNGPGVPDDIKDKLLMPFFTTKKGTEGTGLGLSITHDIIKAHRGTLEIKTEVGEWTVFHIELPKG
ncbi:MAG: two-component regulator propeller domain-containing protein [Algoriphagus aquaeductus]|uniref:two-component regulator propeller domain-containing protein n=1 Tax=Algoriphagus aquaeductus TaxID=475299 RepID=UPI003879EE4F